MATPRTLIQIPAQARAGELVQIRATLGHPMETGYRTDSDGRTVPRDLVRRFSCHYGGTLVFGAELHAAIAANPYLDFFLRAQASGPISLRWEGDSGFVHTEVVQLTVA